MLRIPRDQLSNMARDLLVVVLINTCIAGLFALLSGKRLDVQLVYAHAIGLSIWALIYFGRFAFPVEPPHYWPAGWQRVALLTIGTSVGYTGGTLIGDWYGGYSTLEMLTSAPRRFWGLVAFAAAASMGFTWIFVREARLAAEQRLLTDARLKLIESQIEPHMLFNTLANLRALIETDPPRAVEMLDRLNDYLRATLSASRAREHPLAAEFARSRDYLELMAVRMGARLQFTLDLPPALSAIPVPPLVLQPLVENAIRHGLEPKPAGGTLTIRARHEGDLLHLEVADTGLGFAPAPDTKPATAEGSGFGLAQVRERLQVRYGSAATLSVQPQGAGPGGTIATIATITIRTPHPKLRREP